MAEAKTAARTVTVATNIPNGLVLRAFLPETVTEPVLGGGMRDVKVHREVGRVTVKGPAVPARLDPNFVQPILDKNGFALTHGVDAELWECWLEANKHSAYVVNGCIYAYTDPDKASGDVRAHKGFKSGLEPLAADGDPRMPRRRPNLTPGQGDRAA